MELWRHFEIIEVENFSWSVDLVFFMCFFLCWNVLKVWGSTGLGQLELVGFFFVRYHNVAFDFSFPLDSKLSPADAQAFGPLNHSCRHKMAGWDPEQSQLQPNILASNSLNCLIAERWNESCRFFPDLLHLQKKKKEWVVFIAGAQALHLLEVHSNVLQADLFKANIS